MTRYDIIMREAQRLVRMGTYDDVEEAWSEAEAICEESDSFAILDDEDDYGYGEE